MTKWMNSTAIKLSAVLALLLFWDANDKLLFSTERILIIGRERTLPARAMCESMKMAAWSLKWERN